MSASEETKDFSEMCEATLYGLVVNYKSNFVPQVSGYDHTKLNAQVRIRSLKLGNVEPG